MSRNPTLDGITAGEGISFEAGITGADGLVVAHRALGVEAT